MKGFDTRFSGAALMLCLVLVLFLAGAGPLQAREYAWYAGGGYSSATTAGELDRFDTFTVFSFPPIESTVYGADLESGGGLAINVGFALNKYIGFEVLTSSTTHDAESAGLPGEKLDATISTLLIGTRGMLPLLDSMELFARFGLVGAAVGIERNVTWTPGNNRKDSVFSGGGIGWGAGVAFTFGRFGVEVGATRHQVKLDRLDALDDNNSISSQDMLIDTAHIIFTGHFGKKLK